MPGTHMRFYLGPYLQPIPLHLESGPKSHPDDTNGSVVPAEGSWQGYAIPLGIQSRTVAFIKIYFGTCNIFLTLNRLLYQLYHIYPTPPLG